MRIINTSTISQPIIVDGENLIINGPENGKLIIKADIQVTNGWLMISGYDVIFDSSKVNVNGIDRSAGVETKAHMSIKTAHDLFVLGTKFEVSGAVRIISNHEMVMENNYFAAAMHKIAHGNFHLVQRVAPISSASAHESASMDYQDDEGLFSQSFVANLVAYFGNSADAAAHDDSRETSGNHTEPLGE